MQKTLFAPVDRALTAPPLRTESSLVAVCCEAFGLSASESRVFVMLLKYDHASAADLYAAQRSGGGGQVKAVGVTIHGLRKKLAHHDIEIFSTYGVGYRLAAGARDRTRKLLAAFGEDIVAAVASPAERQGAD